MTHALNLGDGIIYADVDYLAAVLRTPVPTLRRWAHEDKWPRRKIRGRAYYLLASATKSHNQRRRHARTSGA